MDLPFFGLTSNNISIFRQNLFNKIHEIVFHGKGGYDWFTIYEMPIWLRKLTFQKIKSFYDSQSPPENDESWTSGESREIAKNTSKQIKIPDYITKASKK